MPDHSEAMEWLRVNFYQGPMPRSIEIAVGQPTNHEYLIDAYTGAYSLVDEGRDQKNGKVWWRKDDQHYIYWTGAHWRITTPSATSTGNSFGAFPASATFAMHTEKPILKHSL